ncbi:ATPase [Reticulomyxa filosa]|uniref:ATPase n=1 Tax=Reticulomyxa filosa TaxID=46433 RepID=X6NLF5_RETFI|nr:ATPase [Reticulomyxa filosa]|eukprot:ETO26212.1 ATPase [Reticulomyxa filosa]
MQEASENNTTYVELKGGDTETGQKKVEMGVDPKAFYKLHVSRTSKIHFSLDDDGYNVDSDKDNDSTGSVVRKHRGSEEFIFIFFFFKTNKKKKKESEIRKIKRSNKNKTKQINLFVYFVLFITPDDDSDGSEELDIGEEGEAKEMMNEMMTLAMQMTGGPTGGGAGTNNSDEMTNMWSSFLSFKQSMEKPPNAPTVYKVQDNAQGFTALRDLLDAFPSELAQSIFKEQIHSPHDHIRDILLQRGCWPIVRFSGDRHVAVTQTVEFDQVVECLQKYMNLESGHRLSGILDPQHTTGYRLHQVTAVIRDRNEAKHTVTALSFRIGRLWTPKLNSIHDAIDFWSNLDKPASMLLLGPNTAEKAAMTRELTRIISERVRTALVDTRSTIAGFGDCPLECGTAVRFFVSDVTRQHQVIDQTRSISPQVVVVGEVLSEEDIQVLSKLQSEGISVIVGTNMHSLSSLLGHKSKRRLSVDQQHLLLNKTHASFVDTSLMSSHLLILELNYNASKLRVYKNVPEAVRAIKDNIEPKCDVVTLRWGQFDHSVNTAKMTRAMSRRDTSKALGALMQKTISASKHNKTAQLPLRVVLICRYLFVLCSFAFLCPCAVLKKKKNIQKQDKMEVGGGRFDQERERRKKGERERERGE